MVLLGSTPMQYDIQQRAVGRWYGILSALGIKSEFLRNKHGPCPICRAGKDRYRWDNKDGKGTFFCSQCGSGDGFEMLMRLRGWGFRETVEQVESVIGRTVVEATRRVTTPDEQRAVMRARWRQCLPVASGDAVSKYLKRRIGIDIVPSIVRSAPERLAMVVLMQAPDGKATMVHTTFLTKEGEKAPINNCRLLMPGTIAEGAAVRLAEYGEELGIAEGVENALSATALTGIPCWAALNEVLLRRWIAPDGVKRVVIYGDNDESYVGQAAAYSLARSLSRKENAPHVEVRIPAIVGADWNDVVQHQLERSDA